MSGAEDRGVTSVGRLLPEISAVRALDGHTVEIVWKNAARGVIDLTPDLMTFKVYAPLRNDEALFKTVHVSNVGSAIAWGSDDSIDMPATALERLGAIVEHDASVE